LFTFAAPHTVSAISRTSLLELFLRFRLMDTELSEKTFRLGIAIAILGSNPGLPSPEIRDSPIPNPGIEKKGFGIAIPNFDGISFELIYKECDECTEIASASSVS